MNEILIYGIGNPARQDDALGIIFIEKLEKWAVDNLITNLCFDTNYQLNIEDSASIKEKKLVLFVDASSESVESFSIKKIYPDFNMSISSHHVTPETLLELSKELFHKTPSAYLLEIKGYRWKLNKKITLKALKNLNCAYQFLTHLIMESQTLEDIEKLLSNTTTINY